MSRTQKITAAAANALLSLDAVPLINVPDSCSLLKMVVVDQLTEACVRQCTNNPGFKLYPRWDDAASQRKHRRAVGIPGLMDTKKLERLKSNEGNSLLLAFCFSWLPIGRTPNANRAPSCGAGPMRAPYPRHGWSGPAPAPGRRRMSWIREHKAAVCQEYAKVFAATHNTENFGIEFGGIPHNGRLVTLAIAFLLRHRPAGVYLYPHELIAAVPSLSGDIERFNSLLSREDIRAYGRYVPEVRQETNILDSWGTIVQSVDPNQTDILNFMHKNSRSCIAADAELGDPQRDAAQSVEHLVGARDDAADGLVPAAEEDRLGALQRRRRRALAAIAEVPVRRVAERLAFIVRSSAYGELEPITVVTDRLERSVWALAGWLYGVYGSLYEADVAGVKRRAAIAAALEAGKSLPKGMKLQSRKRARSPDIIDSIVDDLPPVGSEMSARLVAFHSLQRQMFATAVTPELVATARVAVSSFSVTLREYDQGPSSLPPHIPMYWSRLGFVLRATANNARMGESTNFRMPVSTVVSDDYESGDAGAVADALQRQAAEGAPGDRVDGLGRRSGDSLRDAEGGVLEREMSNILERAASLRREVSSRFVERSRSLSEMNGAPSAPSCGE